MISTTSISGAAAPPVANPTTPLPDYVTLVALARVPRLSIYDSPEATRPAHQVENPWHPVANDPVSKAEQVFLIESQRADGWLKVLLPIEPNGTSGWVRAEDVRINKVGYKIRIELGARLVTVFRRGEVISQGPVAVGMPRTPTPRGRYYLRALITAPRGPTADYGPYAFGLSSRSKEIEPFAGADGEIGILGTNDASALGRAVTLGSIRMENDALTVLARSVPLGTPVVIVS